MLHGEVTWLRITSFLLATFGGFATLRTMVSGTRFSVKPFICSVCMGFWIGLAVSFYFFPGLIWSDYQMFGLMASGSNWILNKYVNGEN